MSLPTTRVQAERVLAALRERLPAVNPDLVATIIEPLRGKLEIAVVLPGDGKEGVGLAFAPGDLDNGASGISEQAMHQIMRLGGHDLPPLPEAQVPTNVFADVMTTSNVGVLDGQIGADAVLVETVVTDDEPENDEPIEDTVDESSDQPIEDPVDESVAETVVELVDESSDEQVAIESVIAAETTDKPKRKRKSVDEQAE